MTSPSSSGPTGRGSAPAGPRRPRGEVGAQVKRFEVTLEGLRQLRHRVDEQQLEPDDWPLIGALVSKQVARAEQRQERMIAKIAAAAAAAEQEAGGEVVDAGGSVDAGSSTSSSSSSSADATSSGEAEPTAGGGEADQADSKKPKGHGRNGASAYTKAKHLLHALGTWLPVLRLKSRAAA